MWKPPLILELDKVVYLTSIFWGTILFQILLRFIYRVALLSANLLVHFFWTFLLHGEVQGIIMQRLKPSSIKWKYQNELVRSYNNEIGGRKNLKLYIFIVGRLIYLMFCIGPFFAWAWATKLNIFSLGPVFQKKDRLEFMVPINKVFKIWMIGFIPLSINGGVTLWLGGLFEPFSVKNCTIYT